MRAEIYALRHPVNGEVRYIGKANCAKRRLATHIRDSRRRRSPLYSWLRSLESPPLCEVLAVSTGDRWQELERDVIAQWRKETRLLNLAEGGDEPKCSVEVRRRNAVHLNKKIARDSPEGALRALLRRFGCDAHWLSSSPRAASIPTEDRTRTVARLRACMDRIRALRAKHGAAVAAYILRDVIERATGYRAVDDREMYGRN